MVTIKVEPERVKANGYEFEITGISPYHTDCFVGQYWKGADGGYPARWNLSGIMRGGDPTKNLNMGDEHFAELAKVARTLGAK